MTRAPVNVAFVVFSVLSAACGSTNSPSPSGPSMPALPFRAGVHVVAFSGADAIRVGVVPACPGIGVAGIGHAGTEVVLDQVGGAWRARPRTPDGGAFEMRFVPDTVQPDASGRSVAVSATARGLVINTVPAFLQSGARVTLGGGPLGPIVSLSGILLATGVGGTGSVEGDVVFSNTHGVSIVCHSGTVMWTIARVAER